MKIDAVPRYSLRYCRQIKSNEEIKILDYKHVLSLRSVASSQGFTSQTSKYYQDNVLRFIDDYLNTTSGHIVEIGCYKGGLTIQLAYAAHTLRKKLFVFDYSKQNLDTAEKNILATCPGIERPVFFNGTTAQYNQKISCEIDLVVLDANNTYESVYEDLFYLTTAARPPKWIIFHDLDLRSRANDYKPGVDSAISDFFGNNCFLLPLGMFWSFLVEFMDVPSPDPYYHDADLPEGAILFLYK